MGIVIEACRKQYMNVELEPREFIKKACEAETLELLTTEEIKRLAEFYHLEANKRESENAK